jgi:hypothetical protein
LITMHESTIAAARRQSTPRASLAALGLKLPQLDLFAPIRHHVRIPQKTLRYTPTDKLYDALIAILAGAHGIVESNTRVRSDPALQAAFGRTGCAEQSVIQDTFDACDETTIKQMRAALTTIYRRHSRGFGHDYEHSFQLLDVDMTGLPCGPKADRATRGYFAKQRNRRGRQVGRVLATHYGEVVVDELFAGTTQLTTALRPLMETAAERLDLVAACRARTIVRVDGGGGSLDDVNWLLEQGYQVLVKEYSGKRATKLAKSVTTWIDDPEVAGRQVGWVTAPASEYVREVRRIAVRCQKKNGTWAVGVVLTTVDTDTVLALRDRELASSHDETSALLAQVYAYDQRGGGIETANKDDKQGIGFGKRNKKRFEAQQMVVWLGTLAHNILVWARQWMQERAPRLQGFGLKRLVRDVLQINGMVEQDASGKVVRIVLNQAHYYASRVVETLQVVLASTHVVVTLGET